MSREISDLTAATTPLVGDELIHIWQSGNSRKATIADLAASDAINVSYDNTVISGGGLVADNVQDALDELTLYVLAASNVLTDGDKGDIIVSGSGTIWELDTDVVENTNLANMAQSTIKGRAAGAGTGDPTDLTATQATAILNNMVGDSGSGGTKGLVPAPAAGDAAAGKFLKADGTWAVGSTVGDLDDLTDVNTAGVSEGDVLTYTSGVWTAAEPTGGGGGGGGTSAIVPWSITVAASDETTALTSGDSKVTFYIDSDVASLTEVFIGLTEPSASGSVVVDVRKNGSTIFATKPEIEAGEDTSLTGVVAVLLSGTTFSKGDKVEVDIDNAGAAAAGLKVTFIGTQEGGGGSLGKHTIWVPASAMIPATTSGSSALAQVETTTNKINVGVLDFDDAADEYAHFHIAFPKSWNKSTLTYQILWTTTATGTTGVAWGLEAIAISDNEALDTAWGTAVVVTDDAQSAASEILVTSESTALTVGGTPANDDIVFFRVFRDVSDANDDMTEDARLIGIKVFYTIDAETDD